MPTRETSLSTLSTESVAGALRFGHRGLIDIPLTACKVSSMPVEVAFPHNVKPPGEPARTEYHSRTRVAMIVADYLWRGWSAEEIVRQYPYLSLAEVHSALAYYFDHREEIETELVAEYRDAAIWKDAHPTPAVLARLKDQHHHG